MGGNYKNSCSLYRLSPLSGSTASIDTKWETIDTYYKICEEIVSTTSNSRVYVGQMKDKDLADSMLNPTEQRLDQLVPSAEGIEALTALMGTDNDARKDFITGIDFGGFNL